MKVLVIDSGIGLCHAYRFAKDGHEVYYWRNWWKPFPCFEDFVCGEGLVTKVKDFWKYLDEVDLIMVVDSGLGYMVEYLRRNGYNVFGAGMTDRLELDRRYFHEVLDQLGLKYPPSWNVDGIGGVLDFFKNEAEKGKEYFVKVSLFRGNVETFSARSFEEAEAILLPLEAVLGPFGNKFQFVIEEAVEGVEVGFDALFNSRDFLLPILFTFEAMDNTLGKWEFESIWTPVLEKFRSFLAEEDYRGFFSLEAIFDGSDLWLLDPTPRPAYPGSSAIFCQNLNNYCEVINAVALGEDIDFDINSKYVVALNVYTEHNVGRWLVINIDEDTKFWIRRGVMVNGKLYLTAGKEGETLAGVVIGEGDTYEETFEDASEQLSKISLYGMFFNWGVFDSFVNEYIKPLKEYGIEF